MQPITRRRVVAAVAAWLVAVATATAPAAMAHSGNPHFETVVRQVTPTSSGISSRCSIATTACC
jgi:hypothetical protein